MAWGKLGRGTHIAAMGAPPDTTTTMKTDPLQFEFGPDRTKTLSIFETDLIFMYTAVKSVIAGTPQPARTTTSAGLGHQTPAADATRDGLSELCDKVVQGLFSVSGPEKEAAQRELGAAARWILCWFHDARPATGAQRCSAFDSAIGTAAKLISKIAKIGPERLTAAMMTLQPAACGDRSAVGPSPCGSGDDEHPPQHDVLLPDPTKLGSQLSGVAETLGWLRDREPAVSRGAPTLADAMTFAMERLAVVWKLSPGSPPVSLSRKRGQFGAFALDFLMASPFNRQEAEIHTALRYFYAAESRHRRALR